MTEKLLTGTLSLNTNKQQGLSPVSSVTHKSLHSAVSAIQHKAPLSMQFFSIELHSPTHFFPIMNRQAILMTETSINTGENSWQCHRGETLCWFKKPHSLYKHWCVGDKPYWSKKIHTGVKPCKGSFILVTHLMMRVILAWNCSLLVSEVPLWEWSLFASEAPYWRQTLMASYSPLLLSKVSCWR